MTNLRASDVAILALAIVPSLNAIAATPQCPVDRNPDQAARIRPGYPTPAEGAPLGDPRDKRPEAELPASKGGLDAVPAGWRQAHEATSKFPAGFVSWAVINRQDARAAALVWRDGELTSEDCAAYYFAAVTDSWRTLSALADVRASGARIRDADGMTPLIAAAAANRPRSIRVLLERGLADVDETTPSTIGAIYGGHGLPMIGPVGGETALMIAVQRKSVEAARELVRWGADVSAKSFSGASIRDRSFELSPEMRAIVTAGKGGGTIPVSAKLDSPYEVFKMMIGYLRASDIEPAVALFVPEDQPKMREFFRRQGEQLAANAATMDHVTSVSRDRSEATVWISLTTKAWNVDAIKLTRGDDGVWRMRAFGG